MHTPGPWKAEEGEHGQYEINEVTPGGGKWKAIATVHFGRMGGGSSPVQPAEAEANAILMATSPALLAALAELVRVYDKVGGPLAVNPAVARARELIASLKAS